MASKVNDNVSSSIYCQACGASNPVEAEYCFACSQPLSAIRGGSGATTNPLTGLLLPTDLIQQRYCILEVLSSGEVSTVYKVEDIQLGNRVVALKEIRQDTSGTQATSQLIEASRREMLLLAGLIHPNFLRVYDYFVENQCWYFVMDFLAGETLEAYLNQRKYGPLPVEEVFDIGIQLSTVLDYLHIHQSPLGLKDLTTNDIWRTPDGKLYLLDTGTLPLAARSESSSIYNLGMILRQLQAGNASVRSPLPVALPRKRSKHSQFSPLKELIQQMSHKNAGKRHYTMGSVKQELQYLATQYTSLKKHRFSRRRLLKVGGRLTGLAGLAAVSSWLTWQVEFQTYKQNPHPDYSPHLGGTISTYGTGSGVLTVEWSPNGRRLAMGDWNGQVQTWDSNTGDHVINYYDSGLRRRVEGVTWLPDGNSIAAGGDDGLVWVWNAETGKIQRIYRGHTNWVIAVACSPNGKYIASGSKDQTVQVWEVATGRQLVIYRGHSDGIGSVAWSPDGSYIASASFDMTVQIWEAATGRPVYTYSEHLDRVYTVAWSPNGQYIASGGKDHTVRVWPVALFKSNDQRLERTIIYTQHQNSVQAVTWAPNSRDIASTADNVQLWNGLTGEHIFTYTKHSTSIVGAVQAVAWSPNGRYIASGGMEGTVQVWNAT